MNLHTIHVKQQCHSLIHWQSREGSAPIVQFYRGSDLQSVAVTQTDSCLHLPFCPHNRTVRLHLRSSETRRPLGPREAEVSVAVPGQRNTQGQYIGYFKIISGQKMYKYSA
jgi:hypothetical protein